MIHTTGMPVSCLHSSYFSLTVYNLFFIHAVLNLQKKVWVTNFILKIHSCMFLLFVSELFSSFI